MTTLRLGSKGADVKALQRGLNAVGAKPPLDVDSIYGVKTQGAVMTFQTAHGLKPDGIAGPETLAALTSAPVVNATPTPEGGGGWGPWLFAGEVAIGVLLVRKLLTGGRVPARHRVSIARP